MAQKPLPDKLYYGIGEVANYFGVSQSLLRFWESEFSFLKPKRNKKGTRFYAKKDIDQIEEIFFLVKTKGYTLQGAKDALAKSKKGISKNEAVKNELLAIKKELLRLKIKLYE